MFVCSRFIYVFFSRLVNLIDVVGQVSFRQTLFVQVCLSFEKPILQHLYIFFSMSAVIQNRDWIVHFEDRGSGKLVSEMRVNYVHRVFGALIIEALSKKCSPGQFAHSICGCWPIEYPGHVTSIPKHSIPFVRGVLSNITDALGLPKSLTPHKYFLDYVR